MGGVGLGSWVWMRPGEKGGGGCFEVLGWLLDDSVQLQLYAQNSQFFFIGFKYIHASVGEVPVKLKSPVVLFFFSCWLLCERGQHTTTPIASP